MNIANYKKLNLPSPEGYLELLNLQAELNHRLTEKFKETMFNSRESIANDIIVTVSNLVDEVNKHGYKLRLCDYGGDKRYQHSEQVFCNNYISICFIGFSCQIFLDDWVS